MRWQLPRVMVCGLLLVGCGTSATEPHGPGYTPGNPGLGAHSLSYYGLHATEEATISTAPMATQPGSTIVVSVGRGDITGFALPTDNKGSAPYQQQGTTHNYTRYTNSGTALYALTSAAGGADFTVSTSNVPSDEITLAAVEVIEGAHIEAYAWNEVVNGPVTSKTVTTTGPATLVAFWWGDAPEPNNKTAVPNNGFKVVDSILKSGALVQCAVAVKNVADAGTYDVTWTATPVQGAQLWLIAVQ